MTQIPQIILGTQSPRRKEIMSYFSLPFTQCSPSFCEEDIPFNGNPYLYACKLASGKARSLIPLYPASLIITADTVVFHQGKSFGKPKDEEEAIAILSELSGQWHSVFTALCLAQGDKFIVEAEETHVLFNKLTLEQIKLYCKSIHYADKAAGYAIQSAGSMIVRKINGCYYNVMGFPINLLRELLEHFGIDLWQYVKK